MNRLKLHNFNIVLLDLLPDIEESLNLLIKIKKASKNVKVIIVINESNESIAAASLKAGAFDFIYNTKNYFDLLPHIIKKAITFNNLENQIIQTEKLYAVGQLVSSVAHELNNPLLGISGFSKLLLSETDNKRHKKDLKTIYKESLRCQKIVKSLLTITRNNKSAKKLVNINSIIKSVLDIQSYLFVKEKIDIEERLATNLPDIYIDFHKFQQVILNLLSNAYQAVSENTDIGKILIESRLNKHKIIVRISDNGPGISVKDTSKLFQPFYTTKQPGEGTGLGLSICNDIITDHDGIIYAENNSPKGASFIIELPVASKVIDKSTVIKQIVTHL